MREIHTDPMVFELDWDKLSNTFIANNKKLDTI